MKTLFDNVSFKASKITTTTYSTSFSLGIKLFHPRFHDPIYGIYGFVRVADEIVDSFHDFDKEKLLAEFRADTWKAIRDGISLNPILNSFQSVVNKYGIEEELISTFLDSMEMDLDKNRYDQHGYEKYILGSAEVVGLMCLRVFTEGDRELYEKLKEPAMKLGSAFQKINFLRDMQADYKELGRTYFPGIDLENFSEATKAAIESDIEKDFHEGYQGIKMLPKTVRLGVYLAYVYYISLFKKIRRTNSRILMMQRIRIPNSQKFSLIVTSWLRHSMNLL
ncbi:phytoene/squalene synthase family protein [Bacteroidota bacterium]